MMAISYLFFNSDDPEAEPIRGVNTGVVRIDNFPGALSFASNAIISRIHDVVHIFEDDGQGIAPVLTVKRYEEKA